ncbi:MAG TPA: efflux RND transporter periplasmic adaptor subunit [Vicinamibacterales bacterium]|nr:efflux RND transporter periplasmic adaptor subunit [Vicinamibacterales bacterium]
MSRRPVLAAAAAGAMVALAATAACHRNGAADSGEPPPIAVTTAAARLQTLRDVVSAPGLVVPSSAADLTIYAPEVAQIVELPKKEQDEVAAGDVLVRFEIPSLTQETGAMQMELQNATARLDRARAELARQEALDARGLTPRRTLDASRLEAAAAESAAAQAKGRFDAAQSNQERATIRARFPGKVMRVWHAVGDLVQPTPDDPVIRVADPTQIQISVQVPIASLTRVTPGQPATVMSEAGPAAATVTNIIGTTTPSALTGEVRLAFAEPVTLVVDAPVNAEILVGQRPNALTVPTGAVAHDDLGTYVMIAGDDRRAHRREVRPGLVTQALTQIVDGLAPGDRVIVGHLADVGDGAAITDSQ